ncbi:hypothetical protein LGT39_09495 [Demequina sp. TTPB684]|uniref:hypothetical protein n=1 Tax=unclassified Demequina TaxID=2620311 RepID=UPI001CF3659E|nr:MULTISPECIES: hypothetical protein [unclassified Demequina]MCB2413074.1 hypothetical protein [Demequina sp. TTPB684]UPU88118.1 hypothetical protein LGT36_012845 [Demequina sp. TMPB413]
MSIKPTTAGTSVHPFELSGADARYHANPLAGRTKHSALLGDLFPREERPVRREGLQFQR